MAEQIIHKTTPEEAVRLDNLAGRLEAEAPEIAARLAKMEEAEREPGVRGELRRAIRDSLLAPNRLANDAGVDLKSLQDFREGQADLPLSDIERLASRLGMEVVANLVTKPSAA